GIERVIGGCLQRQPLVAARPAAAPDGGDEALHEGIGAVRNEEGHAQVAGAGEQRRRQVAPEIEGLDGVLDLLGRFRADAGARVQHAVDGRERNARRPRHVMYRRPLAFDDVVHGPAPLLQPMKAPLASVNWNSAPLLWLAGAFAAKPAPALLRRETWLRSSRSAHS